MVEIVVFIMVSSMSPDALGSLDAAGREGIKIVPPYIITIITKWKLCQAQRGGGIKLPPLL